MDWIRRNLMKTAANPPRESRQRQEAAAVAAEELGLTQQLIDFVKTFTLETFQTFPLPDEEAEEEEGGSWLDDSPTTTGNVRKDLSHWQQRHATLLLSNVKEISRLRYMLCPRHMKERRFWRIYFSLVKRYLAEYELRAVRLAKLRNMEAENEGTSGRGAYEVEMSEGASGRGAYEVERSEEKQACNVAP